MKIEVDPLNHAIFQIEDAIANAFEEEGVSQLSTDHEIIMKLGEIDNILDILKSVLHGNFIKEPLEDVIFFIGKPHLSSPVYHVLCMQETYERMQRDPNVHFMLMKQFGGKFDSCDAKTLDEQETKNRAELTGSN